MTTGLFKFKKIKVQHCPWKWNILEYIRWRNKHEMKCRGRSDNWYYLNFGSVYTSLNPVTYLWEVPHATAIESFQIHDDLLTSWGKGVGVITLHTQVVHDLLKMCYFCQQTHLMILQNHHNASLTLLNNTSSYITYMTMTSLDIAFIYQHSTHSVKIFEPSREGVGEGLVKTH